MLQLGLGVCWRRATAGRLCGSGTLTQCNVLFETPHPGTRKRFYFCPAVSGAEESETGVSERLVPGSMRASLTFCLPWEPVSNSASSAGCRQFCKSKKSQQ